MYLKIMNHRPVLIDLHPSKLSKYTFIVTLDRCGGNCNTLDNVSDRLCVSNKTKNGNSKVFNMTTRVNKSKSLGKYISFDCWSRLDEKWSNWKQWSKIIISIIERYIERTLYL